MNAAPIFPSPEALGAPKSGLLRMRDAVEAYFLAFSAPAVVAPVGLKYRSFSLNQAAPGGGNRVVFVPGEFDGSNTVKPRRYGSLTRQTRNHSSVGNPRELLNWERPITLCVWAAPVAGASHDEGQTIAVAEDLLELVARAVNAAGGADVTWGSVTINSPPQENGFGVELLVALTQRGPLFDATLEYTTAGTALTGDMQR